MAERFAHTSDANPGNRRLRFELIFASVWLAIGLFLVPALIFSVGIVVLGPYGEGAGEGMGAFYADFFGDLATGEVRAWLLALGPLILVSLLRAVFIGKHPIAAPADEPPAEAPPPRAKTADHRRVEPSIGD